MNRIDILKDLLKLHPNDLFIRFSLAKEFENMEKFDLAIQYYDSILKQSPEHLASYYNKGLLLERLNSFDKSKKSFQLGFEQAKIKTDFEYIALFKENLKM